MLYEFVDLHQDGEQFGTGPCSRKFSSTDQSGGSQRFQSPRDIFLYGRGGSSNIRYGSFIKKERESFLVCYPRDVRVLKTIGSQD